MNNKEKVQLIKAGTDIAAMQDNMFLLSDRVTKLEDIQKKEVKTESPTLTNNDTQECLCESCENEECDGLYCETNLIISPKFTVYKCSGYL